MHSQKYPRTFHFPFSPGTTSDDRIAKSFQKILSEEIVITEKLDGENTCLNRYGVFSRSHGAPTKNPWANYLWGRWNLLHEELGNLEIFGESLYAIHSIEYSGLEEYFYVFAIREGENWLSWEQVETYAQILQMPTVPVLFKGKITDYQGFSNKLIPEENLEKIILNWINEPSLLSDLSLATSPKEGVVARVMNEFTTANFSENVFKWVRKNHIQTDEHWTRNWQRAKLNFEWKALIVKQLKSINNEE